MTFRAREPLAMRHPETGEWVVPALGVDHDDDDPLVREYPDHFVQVEDASAAPGSKRSLSPKSKARNVGAPDK